VNEDLPSSKKTILLVDDIDESRIIAKWFLSTFNYEVDAARSAEEALSRFDPAVHALVLTDNSMPGMTGGEMALTIRRQSPSTPIIMFSGNPPPNVDFIIVVIQKPQHLLAVKEAIDELLQNPSSPLAKDSPL
jgi:CheY-like chemotaxis protein